MSPPLNTIAHLQYSVLYRIINCVKPQSLLRDYYGIIIDESTRTINGFMFPVIQDDEDTIVNSMNFY